MIIDRNSPVPQYFQLQRWLVEQIEQGVFKPGDKIPTEAELVQMAGLARATIRQAIQNLVNLGYLTRKRKLGTFVMSRVVDNGNRKIIGLLVPDIRVGYAPELARGAEDEAANNKQSLILCNTDDLFIKAEYHAERLIENSVAGVIFVPTAASDEKNKQVLEKFTSRNIPVVLADRIIPGVNIDHVTTDNFDGAYKITEYLIKKGHEKIAITLSTLFSSERERLEGYRKALSDYNLPIDKSIILTHDGRYSEKPYIEFAKKIFKQRKKLTAMFAGHDRIAYLLSSVAVEMGMKIPEDISIVGYDDLLPHCQHQVSLTTMHQPIYEMGVESMKLINRRINGLTGKGKSKVLKSYLIERESVFNRNK
ncbi:MAG: GntR family transcriptional regulator [Melioribacteraceae bacterium]|nr:MAG: GntR family transcriptional regulator [Melioribacteraceae bacterium]